ncbi:MAG: hypothetical protein E7436_05030 [Ruminococcaceae bacterium]|nr:hypothetical protein [Oscillospiraceae bacterium]
MINTDQKQCKNCQYYLQHYTFDRRKIFLVYCGHCTHYFVAGAHRETAFVNNEYLSKELLQYMLQLELLLEIKESG